jgi:predicted phage terminase large subunit-like protein
MMNMVEPEGQVAANWESGNDGGNGGGLVPADFGAEEARREWQARREARRSLLGFTMFTFPQYRPEPAHGLIAETLDRVVDGTLRRLIIVAPPQHGKSELTSVRLPAFWLGRRPDDPVIISSYGASLAKSKSRQAREIVGSPEYQVLFGGVRVPRDNRSASHWMLAGGLRGGLLAVGVGGPITGHGAMLGIIDDPLKNWQEAQSALRRERTWEWYRATFRTRIWEGGAIVVICTRWHEDDLVGRLLASAAGGEAQAGASWTASPWTVLRLPALAEARDERDDNDRRCGLATGQPDPLGRAAGEPLCPVRFSAAALEAIRRDVGYLAWQAEYQGTPRAPEGNSFQRGWLTLVDSPPAMSRRARYWDRAATPGGGCATAGVLMGLDAEGQVYILDVVRGHWAPGDRDRVMRQTAECDGHGVDIWVEQEPGSAGVDAVAATARLLAGFKVAADRVTGSKDRRMEPLASQAQAGRVHLVRGPWNAAFVDELCLLPNGPFRDQADAAGGAYNQLARTRPVHKSQILQARDPLEQMDREGF